MCCYACGSPRHTRAQCPHSLPEKPHEETRCYNCGQDGHLQAMCPKPSLKERCFHCSEWGHQSADCPFRHDGSDTTSQRICYQCHQPGHFASSCPEMPPTCHRCGEVGHIQARCPQSVCRQCHQAGHYSSQCPASPDGPTSAAPPQHDAVPAHLVEDDRSSVSTSAAPNLASSPPTPIDAAQSSVPLFEPQAQVQVPRRGRVAVIIDGAYFERCVVSYTARRDAAQYLKCKELLKYTLDFIGQVFEMSPIAYWFDTDPSSFAAFVETQCSAASRESILRDCDLRKKHLTDAMNGGKELSNVVAKLVGGMKRQKGFTEHGIGSVWVQTGVDVSIATCVVECFQDRRQYQQVVLVSGDSDLFPCVHYCNGSRRNLPLEVPPVRVCGTSGTISKVFGQHQDLSDFLPRILLDEPLHCEGERTVPFKVSLYFR